jgi:hypothetical protein
VSCLCYLAHGVEHICDTCMERHSSPVKPWVPLLNCRICILEQVEKLESELRRAQERLRYAVLPRDEDGQSIPPHFLTAKGWER